MSNGKKKKEILIVDCNPERAELLEKVISNLGHTILNAASTEQGLELLEKHAPHLILYGSELANADTFQFLIGTRMQHEYSSTPLLFLAEKESKEFIMKSISLGANDVITGQITTPILLGKVKKMLQEFEFPSYTFKNGETLNATAKGEIVKINEIGCILETSIKFKQGMILKIDSPFLEKLGAGKLNLRVQRDSMSTGQGIYSTDLFFIGMDEKIAQNIRKMRT